MITKTINKRIEELKEAISTKSGNIQFDNGFNIAANSEINFLKFLLSDVEELELELKMLRGKRKTPKLSGKRYKNVTEMFLDR